MKIKRSISLGLVIVMTVSVIPSIVQADNETYTCDFSSLVTDNAKTEYGTADSIIQIDEYTTAYLTYEGTYVDADGTVYLMGSNGGKGNYKNGSYIEFTAPSDGTVNFTINYANYFIDETYKGYSSKSEEMTAGQKLRIGERANNNSKVNSITFTPSQTTEPTEKPTEETTDEPTEKGSEYVSPSTTWDFDLASPLSEGKNMPILGGNAVWNNSEVQFPASDTQNGLLTVDMDKPIKNNVTVEFDAIDHSKALGQQYFNYAIQNSEETIVDFQVHPYDDSRTDVKGLVIGGETVADYKTIRAAWGAVGTHHIKTDIDYNARKVMVTIGSTSFTGEIPEGTVSDVKNIKLSSTRTKTATDRYISVDNFKIEEFTSTEPTASATVTEGYSEDILSEIPYRVNVMENAPAVIYLAGEQRMGNDNVSQLYDAKPIFDKLKGKATLVAPQSKDVFTDIATFVSEVKQKYNAPSVTVVGQSQNVAAAMASGADKIITIAGTGNATPGSKVWVFSGYNDNETSVSDIKQMVHDLQTAGVATRYTEYPFEGHKINNKVSEENGLPDWILNDNSDAKTVDLVLFAGQSNMAGRGEYEKATVCEPGHGFEYHPVTEPGVLTTVGEPFGKYENNDIVNDNSGSGSDRRSGDMVSSFMESYYQTSGVPIVGVQCSRGGTESKWWNTWEKLTEMASRYKEAQEYLESCGYTVNKKFMVWCQGCSDADANRNIDTYKSNTKAVFESLKANAGITDMFMVRIGHCKTSGAAAIDSVKDPCYKQINLAQKALADEESNITAVASLYTDKYAELMRDQYHYYQEAYNSIGETAGNNTAYTLYNKGSWTEYPEPSDDEILTIEEFEITSTDSEVDVSGLRNYGTTTYRVYSEDGTYETVMANNGKVKNSTGGAVTIVPEYKFEFTNTENSDDAHIAGYTKVGENSYTKENGYGLAEGYSINENGCLCNENPIMVDLAKGFYDIELYRKGGTRSDVYVNGVQIVNNTTSSGSQNRPSGSAVMSAPRISLPNGTASFTIGNLASGNKERIASIKIARIPEKYKKSVIWVAGDSESANYFPIDSDGNDLDSSKIMMTGFGMQLSKMLSDKYSVANFGQPSATVKTWYDECFESVESLIQKGDTIIVDFGINDSVSSSNSISKDEMKQCMKDVADAVKAKGAKIILVSPVYNNKYQHRTYFTYNADTDSNEMTDFAKEIGVNCIDLNRWTQLYVNSAKETTGDENWVVNNYHVGDKLHLTQHSAVLAASFIAAGMSDFGYETSDFSYTYKDISEIGDGYMRGTETGVTRTYSVSEARKFMGMDTPTEKLAIKYNDNTSKVTVEGGDGSISSGILVKAVYDKGELKSVKMQNIDFSKGADVTPEKNMKLFVWESFDTMQPLTDSYVYTGQGEEISPSPTLEPTAPSTSAPTEETKEMIYSEDFEGYSTGDKAGWTSPAGTMSVKSDSTSGIGMYQTVVSGKSGTCRSGYVELPTSISENFVFECDYKSSSNVNVSDLELLENKNAVYSNHGVYSNKNYVFTMARPSKSNCYVINNKSDDSGFTIDRYTDPVFNTKDIENNPWLHIKVVGDMTNQRVIVYITSLDGKTEYHHGMYDMNVGRDGNVNSWKCIHLLSPSTGADTCIDNIEVYKARKSDLSPIYHEVTMTCKSDSFKQYVADGESVVNIPDVSNYGEYFEGWTVGDDTTKYTSEQLKNVHITSNCEIVGNVCNGYIEEMQSVEFRDFPANSTLVSGADENTFASNPISLAIVGEQGTSFVTNPDDRVEDYYVEWTFDGFRTLDGKETGETGEKYCDSYAVLKTTDTSHNTAVDFTLKKTSANYYGKVTAKVTYHGKTTEISKPLVFIGDKQQDDTVILPNSGYTADFNKYEDSMVGYEAVNDDIVVGGWSRSGSDSTHMTIQSDSNGKYLSVTRDISGNSSYFHQLIGNIDSETVFEQDIRFNVNGVFEYGADTSKNTTTAFNSTAFKLRFDNTKFTFNDKELCSAEKGKWYHVVITADPTSKLCNVKIYDYNINGKYSGDEPLAQMENIEFDSSFTSGLYVRYTLSETTKQKSIDINNVYVRRAVIDESSFVVNGPTSISIPTSGNETIDITAAAKTIDGTDALGKATWEIDDEFVEGVTVSSIGNKSAQIKVNEQATSGELPIKVTIGGKSKTVIIKLIGTNDSIGFTTAPTGVKIGNTANYNAVLRNGSGDVISGDIVYELYDSDNLQKINPIGISMDTTTGTLTVSENAQAQIIGVRASSGDVSKFIRVNIYNWKFMFGINEVKDGYTPINISSAYNENRGYGIEGVGTVGSGTMSNITFKLKVEKGKVYNVKAKYKGKIICEKINSDLSGFERTKSQLETDTYDVAVFGGDIMDVTVPVESEIESIEITTVSKSKQTKPDWWTIGDSTVQQNGSWAYTIASTETTDLSKYPELAEIVTGFHNSGKAGEQHKSFYANGRLNSILTKLNPGDVVSISGMGTNDSSSSFEQFKSFDETYMNAIIEMGAYVILGSYTPTGNYGSTQGKVYDADTMTFKGMRTNEYDRAIREVYEENKDNPNVLGFLDIGKTADEKMTADVKSAYNDAIALGKNNDEAHSAANAKAEEMMAWWKDYNHYYTTFSTYILPEITSAVATLIKGIK